MPWGYSIDSFGVMLFTLRACSMLSHIATLAGVLAKSMSLSLKDQPNIPYPDDKSTHSKSTDIAIRSRCDGCVDRGYSGLSVR